MKLKILLPTDVFLEQEVRKVVAEAPNGSFCLLPRHVDFVTALVPGLLSFETNQGEELFVAVNEGILIKCLQEVLVSTSHAALGRELGTLRRTVEDEFEVQNDREMTARSAMARIEAGFVRRFLEIQGRG
jgi:F-type H+-transporting ATPase subunit epsilon